MRLKLRPNVRTLLLTLLLILPSLGLAQTPNTLPDGYRHFIMPTGKAVTGGYAGFWELAFLQAGVGFDDVLSLSAGFTVMPTVAFRSQFGFVQAKATVVDAEGFSFATGYDLLRLTSANLYHHIFAVATYETPDASRFTGLFFYKLSGADYPIVDVIPYGTFTFVYGGPIGLGAGFDTPLPMNKNVRILLEAWNHDVQSPGKLAVMGGLRVETKSFSSDFGLMYFSQPIIAPVANFVWRF